MNTVQKNNRTYSPSPSTSEGQLYAALCLAFASDPAGIKLNSFGTGDCYTHLSRHSRSAQVYTGFGRQDFQMDFSEAGSMVAKGHTLEFDRAVEALTTWLSRAGTVEDLIAQHPSCDVHRPRDIAPAGGASATSQDRATSP